MKKRVTGIQCVPSVLDGAKPTLLFLLLHMINSETPKTWNDLSEQEQIEWLAVEVMGWEKTPKCEYWVTGSDGDGYTWHADADEWNPLKDWNHFRQIQERLMEDGKSQIIKNYLKQFEGKQHYMGADLLEHCQELYNAVISLPSN